MRVLLLICAISLVIPLLQDNAVAQGTQNQTSGPLSLRGTVESVQVIKDTSSSAYIAIKLKMELINTGSRPVIFLKRAPIFPGARLAKSPEDLGTNNILASEYGGPSNDISPEWTTLRSSLDQPSPPPDETLILMPGESWPLEAPVGFPVPINSHKTDTFFRETESLPVIQELSPVWLRVVCEVWPFNVELPALGPEREKLKFGHKLQKRWNDEGLLWLDTIYSEPIMLDLRSKAVAAR